MSSRHRNFPIVALTNQSKITAHIKTIREESGLEASAYDRAASYGLEIFPNHRVAHKTLERLLNVNKKLSRGLDYSALRKLTTLLRQSKTVPVFDDQFHPKMKNGKPLYELVVLGCRVKFRTQQELANSIGCSRQHINEQLGIMYELMIIVDKGHGWVDLNPNVYWHGKMDHQVAYCNQYCRLVWRREDEPTLVCAWPLYTDPKIDGPVYMSWEDDVQ